jgi:hypothetical protein
MWVYVRHGRWSWLLQTLGRVSEQQLQPVRPRQQLPCAAGHAAGIADGRCQPAPAALPGVVCCGVSVSLKYWNALTCVGVDVLQLTWFLCTTPGPAGLPSAVVAAAATEGQAFVVGHERLPKHRDEEAVV